MTRARTVRLAVVALAAVLALVAASAARPASDGIRVTPAGGVRFPDRAFVLSLPKKVAASSENVEVRENGKVVPNTAIIPAGASRKGSFGVVLVLDASDSMRGKPIENATAAARAFVERRQPNQAVAIVTFNSAPYVLLPFTTDPAKIDAALASPPALSSGTHLYDAVKSAVSLLDRAKIEAGSIVVLSDGADTGSDVSLAQSGEAARADHVRIFSVGLRSKAFSPAPLRQLASDAGGTYSEARRAEDLTAIYNLLGAQLSSEYLVRYRSTAGPREHVEVQISVDGLRGTGVAAYETPALPRVVVPPFHRPLAVRFLLSAASMLAISLACASLVALAVLAAIRPRKRTLQTRLSEFVSLARPPEEERRTPVDRLSAGAQRSIEQTRWWHRFKEELEIAGITMPAIQIVAWTAIATVVAAWVLVAVGGSGIFALLALGVPLIVRGAIKRRLQRQRRLFAEQLPDNLQVLASALRAGHSLVGALSVVVDDSPEPSRSELRRVVTDEQLGVPLEDAFGVVVRRMDSRDIAQVALVATLQRETGGNTAEVLDRVAENVRERFELRRLVSTLTAQGRMSRWVMTALPIGLLVLLTLINPEYMAPLYTSTAGRIVLMGAALLIIAGSLVIKRIVDIKV